MVESKYGAQIKQSKIKLSEIEKQNRIAQIEIEIAKLKIEEHQRFLADYNIKSTSKI